MNVTARTAYMESLISKNKNLTVPWYLMASYLYYLQDISIVTDAGFDNVARVMIEHGDTIEHRHKQLITKDMLRAGTGFNLRDEDYPGITKSAAWHLAREDNHVRFHRGKWVKTS